MSKKLVIPTLGKVVEKRIFLIRHQRIMLSPDLAQLYRVEPRILIQAVKRNQRRFPSDFMFQLTDSEWRNLKSQFVISSIGHGGSRRLPYAFTEQGVAMLSSVLHSDVAIDVNIEIMRAFLRSRELMTANTQILKEVTALEKRVTKHDGQLVEVFKAIRDLVEMPKTPRRPIGIKHEK